MVTAQADWSLDFDIGMSFFEWHGPVPLPQALVDYKGLTRHRDTVVEWLSPFDDGAPTSPGGGPD